MMDEALSKQDAEMGSDAWRWSLAKFAEGCSYRNTPWLPYAWVDYLTKEIEDAVRAPNGRLIINAPPRHGKSMLVSHWLPTWYLDWWPENRIILCSYGGDFASDWGKKVRDEFLMNERLWTKLRTDSKARGSWETVNGGGMKCAGVGGPITGRGADLCIIDDPHKNWEEAMSPQARERVIEWFNGTLYNRLEPGASIVVIQTRWHEQDLTGYLIDEHKEDWKVIRFPALAETNDLIGREEGDALCPERYTKERLELMKETMGSYIFAGLYQQRPAPLQGGMLQKGWFKKYTHLPIDPDEWLQTWDLQFKATGTSYCVGQVWCRKGSNMYLADQKRAKMGFNDQVHAIKNLSLKWPQVSTIIIEDAADAQAVKDTLKDQISGLVLVPAKGSKEANLAAVSGCIEAGNVHIPIDADWADAFLLEATTFPNALNDDQVDAMSMALRRLTKKSNVTKLILPSTGVRENPWRM
jgi:predicted phage terminase large subunit-like protein